MSATRIVDLNDGRTLIESFDYRSEFAMEEFQEWIVEALSVELRPLDGDLEADSFEFEFEGETFRLSWEDEHGCFVEGSASQRASLERIQRILAGRPR